MNAVILPSSSCNALAPLILRNSIQTLSILGKPLSDYTNELVSVCLKDPADETILIEENLMSVCDIKDALVAYRESTADICAILRKAKNKPDSRQVILTSSNIITDISGNGYRSVPSEYELEGIYILNEHTFNLIETENITGENLIEQALSKNLLVYGYISDRCSVTVKTAEDYRSCHISLLKGELSAISSAVQIKPGIWIENGADIENGVKIETPVYISKGCRIERGSTLGSYTFIGENSTVKSGSVTEHSIIGKNCTISEKSIVCGCYLSDNVNIGISTEINEGAIIGKGCRIENNCEINAGVRIWPNKRIMSGTRLNDNLVWGSVATERLFNDGRIYGEINIDITPEFMAKLGAAAGTLYRSGKIGLSFDSAPVCSMLASALESGLVSTGIRLYKFGEQSLPIMRDGTKYYGLSMSVHICQPADLKTFCPEIFFIDDNGSDISISKEKKLEDTFFSNIFSRANPENLNDPLNVNGYKLSYAQNILNSIQSTVFRKNFEARTRSETVSDILELVIGEIELLANDNAEKEFSVDISSDGQSYILYDTSGNKLNNNELLCIIVVVLLKHLKTNTIVLPVSAPSDLEKIVYNNGGSVIFSGTNDRDFMNTLLDNELFEQFRLCFDGVYASIMILDYLNLHNVSFNTLTDKIPVTNRCETEIECPDIKKNDLIKQMYEKYKNSDTDLTDGIKIYRDNGWVLILPERNKHFIRIITEGYNTEAAEDLSRIFTNQIKRLAKHD